MKNILIHLHLQTRTKILYDCLNLSKMQRSRDLKQNIFFYILYSIILQLKEILHSVLESKKLFYFLSLNIQELWLSANCLCKIIFNSEIDLQKYIRFFCLE